ncbi:MAG: MFS transporter [Pseudomonadota bacterium]
MQRAIIFAGLIVFAMGQTILFALLGPAAREMGFAEWQVGAIISTSAVVFVAISASWGRIADRWGRKNTIVTGLLGYSASTFLFAWLLDLGIGGTLAAGSAFAALLGARVVYSLTTSGIQPAAVAMMADLTSTDDRSAGVAAVGAAFGLGTVLGPALAFAVVGFGLLTPLWLAAGAAFVIACLAARFVKDPPRQNPEDPSSLAAKPDERTLAPFLFLALGTFVAISAIQQTMAFYIQDFTAADAADTARLAGNAFVVLALAMLFIQGVVVQRFKPSPVKMLAIGFPIAGAGVAVMALAPTYWIIVAGFGVMGAGLGLVQPGISAIVSLATGAQAQGNAAGYVQAAMAGGFVIGPLAGTLIYPLTPSAPLWLALVCCVACYAVFLWVAQRQDTEAEPKPAEASELAE